VSDPGASGSNPENRTGSDPTHEDPSDNPSTESHVGSAPPEVPVPPIEAVAGDQIEATGSGFGAVLRLRNFRRLWAGMLVSSLGDWVGLFALLSVTNRLSPGNTLAVAGLMISRVLPAFLVGPLAGVVLDRIDRRKAMIASDIVRACLIASVPFVKSVPTLYVITFMLEVATLVWMPAKDALVPNLVPKRLLVATNSLALFTTYGVFPIGALVFTALVGVAAFLGTHITALADLGLNRENLAFWIDTATFIASAIIVSRVRVPQVPRQPRPVRLAILWEELVEGLRYLRERGEVARVMRSIGVALAGGAVIFSLGAPYSTVALGGGPESFGAIVAGLGTGMGAGVLLLGFVGDRFPKGWSAALAVIFAGLMLGGAAISNNVALAVMWAGLFGAGAGVAYATMFALLQELVHDEVRGRIFASVQVVIRVSLFVSLVVFPAMAELFTTALFDGGSEQGIRLALATGGLFTAAAGLYAAWDVYRGRIDSEAAKR
jgi:dTMP kinase